MKDKGFTLIELLVVVAIIGVLASVVLASLNDARARARDAKRLADIQTFQTALEVYNLDNGRYPITSWASSNGTGAWSTLETQLGTTLPVDPLNSAVSTSAAAATVSGNNYVYSYFGHPSSTYCAGAAYMLIFKLEAKNGDGANDGVVLCNGSNYTYGESFVVGFDRDSNFKRPDTSGTDK